MPIYDYGRDPAPSVPAIPTRVPMPPPPPPHEPPSPADTRTAPAPGAPAVPGWMKQVAILAGLLIVGDFGLDAYNLYQHSTPAPAPGPGPGPGPSPTPKPVPITGTLWTIYVVDGENVTPAQAAVRTSTMLRSGLKALNCEFRSYDSRQAALAESGLDNVVKTVGLPCAVIQTDAGKVLASIKAPTEEMILSTVKQYRGTP